MTLLSPTPKLQFFDLSGNPLVNAKLYTYAAGTDTLLATYTDYGGGTPNTNPVRTNERGECNVWLGSALYKFVLYTSTDALIWTVDNIGGAATLASLAGPNGSSLVGFIQAGADAVARTVQAKLRDVYSVMDFGAVADGVTDNTEAFAKTLAAVPSTGGSIYIPRGRYFISYAGANVDTNPLVTLQIGIDNVFVYGDGPATEIIMGDLTLANLNGGPNDPLEAGNDVATVINFNSVTNGGVSDIRFTGTWDGTGSLTLGKARAKGVGGFNSQRVIVKGLFGFGLLGNLVNSRGTGTDPATGCSQWVVSDCVAEQCVENGFNPMGGCFDSHWVGLVGINCGYNALENGCNGLVASVTGRGNARYCFSNVGNNVVATVNSQDNDLGGVAVTSGGTGYESDNVNIYGTITETTGGIGFAVAGSVSGGVSNITCWASITADDVGVDINSGTDSNDYSNIRIMGPIKTTAINSTPIIHRGRCTNLIIRSPQIVGPSYGYYEVATNGSGLDIEGTVFKGMGVEALKLTSPRPKIVNITTQCNNAAVTASISTTTMTISATASGTVAVGQQVIGAGVSGGTVITAIGTYNGSTGTVTVSISQTVGSVAMTLGPTYSFDLGALADYYVIDGVNVDVAFLVDAGATHGMIGPCAGVGNPMVGNVAYTPNIADGSNAKQAITVAGALPGDMVKVSFTGTPPAGVTITGTAGAALANSTLINNSGGAWNPAAASLRAEATRNTFT